MHLYKRRRRLLSNRKIRRKPPLSPLSQGYVECYVVSFALEFPRYKFLYITNTVIPLLYYSMNRDQSDELYKTSIALSGLGTSR